MMLFKSKYYPLLLDGSVTLAFRRWRQPRVRQGTQFKTPVGLMEVDLIEPYQEKKISDKDARQAGFSSVEELLEEVNAYDGELYRIELHYAGPDPRIALRQQDELSSTEFRQLRQRLARYESKVRWTHKVLSLIANNAGRRSLDMAKRVPMRPRTFKRRVRQLKELGLTESLGTGYRISPRGLAYLSALEQED